MHQSSFFSLIRLIPIAFFLLVNYLSYLALIRWIPFFKSGKRRLAFWVLAFLSFLPILYSLTTGFGGAGSWLRWTYYPALSWNIGLLIFLFSVPIVFLLHRLRKSLEHQHYEEKNHEMLSYEPAFEALSQESPNPIHKPENLTRRELLQGALTAVPFIALGIATEGVLVGDHRIVTRTLPVIIPGLSKNLDGVRLVQVSDVHLGTFFPLNRWDVALEMIQRQKPDILAITGDFIDDLVLLPEAVRRLESLVADLGSFYCLGNHEHFRNLSLVKETMNSSKVVHLENTFKTVAHGELCLVGVDYPFTVPGESKIAVRRRLLNTALTNTPPDVPKILLAHNPDSFNEAKESGIALTLAGHTHGGQVGIGNRSLFPWAQQYMRGWYGDGRHQLFVHSGLGHWLPFRLGCPSEIVTFVLRTG